MQIAQRFVAAAALALLAASSSYAAATVVYTSSSTFLANVAPGAFFENFNGLGDPVPTAFSGGAFAYTVSASSGLYASGEFLGTNQAYETLTISFTSGNVTAIGGNFYASDLGDAFQPEAITLLLSDLTTVSFTPTSAADSYRGFTSDVFITSMTITAADVPLNAMYAGLDNLTVGSAVSAVPEPASWLLAGLGLAGLAAVRRRQTH